MPRSQRRYLDKLGLFQDLGYEPHPGQLEVHRSRAPRRVLVCGVRWGKSLCCAFEAIAAALEPATESLGWIVAPSYELADRVYRTVEQVATQQLAHRLVPIRGARRRILLRNMAGGLSEIRAKAADRPDSLLGEGLDWLIIDEAARLRPNVWEEYLSQRLVDRQGWALIASTPRGTGWFHDLFLRGDTDPLVASWNFPSASNPHLEPAAIERERERLAPEVFEQEYEAAFLGANHQRICQGCEPKEGAHRKGVIVVHGEEEVPTCPDCGQPVDRDGCALGRVTSEGKLLFKVIRLSERGRGLLPPELAPSTMAG